MGPIIRSGMSRFSLFLALMVCSPLAVLAQAATDDVPSGMDAERRIVWNLANGNDRYDGVSISYNFRVLGEGSWTSPEHLKGTVSAYFDHVLSTDLLREGEHILLRVTTQGDPANHAAYAQVLADQGSTLGDHPRIYSTLQQPDPSK